MPVESLSLRSDIQDKVNRRVYHTPGVDRFYSSQTLSRVEAIALLKYQSGFAGRDVLDIGVGVGRTAIYLSRVARRYEGIDYSPVMVDRCRTRMPEVSVRLADMRKLSPFKDHEFDFVFASNNVIDAVSHEDRLLTLGEFNRVLRPGGIAIITSHNRSYADAGHRPALELSRNPVTQARNFGRWIKRIYHYTQLRSLRRYEPGFALLNDVGHDFACLHYYIDQKRQREQLRDSGFHLADVLDIQGDSLVGGEAAASSPHLLYIAVK